MQLEMIRFSLHETVSPPQRRPGGGPCRKVNLAKRTHFRRPLLQPVTEGFRLDPTNSDSGETGASQAISLPGVLVVPPPAIQHPFTLEIAPNRSHPLIEQEFEGPSVHCQTQIGAPLGPHCVVSGSPLQRKSHPIAPNRTHQRTLQKPPIHCSPPNAGSAASWLLALGSWLLALHRGNRGQSCLIVPNRAPKYFHQAPVVPPTGNRHPFSPSPVAP